ncbi:MAG: hypothetical protein RIR70_1686 [Pseudomonadota bacterium]
MTPRWDIFCKVVDNLGDIGVCWRLARLLHDEHGLAVRLWVDDLAAHQRICPGVVICDSQVVSGIEVRHWPDDFSMATAGQVAEVVIDAFGCGLPAAYLAAMPADAVWVNLEYLSAEPWVAACHGLHSRLPDCAAPRRFFFPGFTPHTGGLMREHDLVARRQRFEDAGAASAFLATLGVPADARLKVLLFCYPSVCLPTLIEAMDEGPAPVLLLIPEGAVAQSVLAQLAAKPRRGFVEARAIPFVPQESFDELLWSMDVNIVRGEDSFVRAQWAAKPFVWHIYPQEGGAHLAKLEAFMARYTAASDPQSNLKPWSDFNLAWNEGTLTAAHWHALKAALPALSHHAQDWATRLSTLPELTSALVQFCAKPV